MTILKVPKNLVHKNSLTESPHIWKKTKSDYILKHNNNSFKQILGATFFYIGTFVLLPYLYHIVPFELFTIVYANVDMLGNILGTALPEYFDYTYSTNPKNLFSYLSTTFINLTAICGILFQGAIAIDRSGIHRGLTIMCIMVFVTFLLPTLTIPYIQKYVISKVYFAESQFTSFSFKKRLVEILTGILMSIMFIYSEYLLLSFLIKTTEVSTKKHTLEKSIHSLFFKQLSNKVKNY